MLLFVSDEVFGACLNSSALDAANGVGEQFTGKVWVRTESFPVATAFGGLSHQIVSVWAQVDVQNIVLPFQDRLQQVPAEQ